MRRPQNWKKSPNCFDKTALFTQCRGRFFQLFVAFSEKLNFTALSHSLTHLNNEFVSGDSLTFFKTVDLGTFNEESDT